MCRDWLPPEPRSVEGGVSLALRMTHLLRAALCSRSLSNRAAGAVAGPEGKAEEAQVADVLVDVAALGGGEQERG
jgi:hypothetical protein